MPNTKECPFCHEDILVEELNAHLKIHTDLKSDGQMQDHVSIKEEKRYTGSLDEIPQVYIHDKCGRGTGMPEFIIRTYLVDPTVYNNYTFCVGCGEYVHNSEVRWKDTGETLYSYNRKLLNKYFWKHPFKTIKAKTTNSFIDLIHGKKPMKG